MDGIGSQNIVHVSHYKLQKNKNVEIHFAKDEQRMLKGKDTKEQMMLC